MNLPFIKNFNKKVLPSYFLVLVLRDEKANAVVFEELNGRIKTVGHNEEYFPDSIDSVSADDFLQTLDKAISEAEVSLPENIQTQKTIFGVKESWTENDQIKKEHLVRLKKASEELGLTPIGFLVISQAISHLLAKEEGAPISAILTEVNEKTVTVTLIRAGKTIEAKSSEIHESIPFTVDTLLKHFDIPEILPSRIIIFNGKEDLSQEFISHAWSKSLPFLHLPQITNLPLGFDAKAVLFGAATQMGFSIANTEDTEMSTENTEKPQEAKGSLVSADNSAPSVVTDFGFTKDMDVAKAPPRHKPPAEKEPESIPQIEGGETEHFKTTSSNEKISSSSVLIRTILIAILSALFILTKKINIKKVLSVFTKVPKGKATVPVLAFLLLIVVLIGSYFLFIKATVEITIDPKIAEKTQNVLFSTRSNTSPGERIIKGEFVTISEDGTVSTAATGKKDVGTNAKGTATIFNSLSQSKTLNEGTILKTANGLEFTLDSSATVKGVASHSADENPPPEKTTVNVTADQLGKESNLPSGTKFTVGSFDTSDLIAKNDNPFSGGTKKEVTVVSKNDQDKLEKDLSKQLENKAREELIKQINRDKILLPAFVSSSLSKKNMDKKVGDETSQITLTGTIEYQGISYSKSDLIEFSKFLLEKDISKTQEVDYNNIKTSVGDIENKNEEEIEANLNIKALLLPKIDRNKLIKDIKGKSFKATEDQLYELSQVSNVRILLSPKIPFLPKKLPIRKNNIKISIKIDG